MTKSRHYTFTIQQAPRALSQGWGKMFSENVLLRTHWAPRWRFIREVKDEVRILTLGAGRFEKIKVHLKVWYPKEQHPDEDNAVGGLHKIVVDALRDEYKKKVRVYEGMIPNDTKAHIEHTIPELLVTDGDPRVEVDVEILA